MDFSNHKYWPLFTINGHTAYITDSILGTWIVMAVLVILTVTIRIKMKSFKDTPAGPLQNLIELSVESMNNMADSGLGKGLSWLDGYFYGVFIFIVFANYAALFHLRPPTADFATTLALALNSFVLIHFLGITRRKSEYLKDYLKPFFLFLPMNIVGELSRPVSLSFRLFGNLLGGTILVHLLYASLPFLLRIGLPNVIHLLEVFIGALQAYIFCVLSMTFINEKASFEEE